MSEEREWLRPKNETRLLLKNPEACGMGRGSDCCAFLLSGREGFECGRVTELKDYLIGRAIGVILPQMHARRLPVEPYPECQIFAKEGGG